MTRAESAPSVAGDLEFEPPKKRKGCGVWSCFGATKSPKRGPNFFAAAAAAGLPRLPPPGASEDTRYDADDESDSTKRGRAPMEEGA